MFGSIQSSSASRYAADQSRAAQKYSADKSYEGKKNYGNGEFGWFAGRIGEEAINVLDWLLGG